MAISKIQLPSNSVEDIHDARIPAPASADNSKVLGVTDTSGTLGWVAQSGGSGSYLPLAGGAMTGPITVGRGDGNGLLFDTDANINVNGTENTILGFYSGQFIISHSAYELKLRGSGTRPLYNSSSLALISDIPSVPVTDVTVGGTSVVSSGVAAITTESVSAIDLETPVETSYPSGGFRPNKIYDLGSQTGSKTYALYTTGLDTTVKNEWVWSFVTGSTAPSITWPSPTGMKWDGGSAPTINSNCLYEISIRLIGSYYVGYYKEIEL